MPTMCNIQLRYSDGPRLQIRGVQFDATALVEFSIKSLTIIRPPFALASAIIINAITITIAGDPAKDLTRDV